MMRSIVVAALGAGLALVGFAAAAPQADTYTLSAALSARSEVPRPAGVRAGAKGAFTGKAVELENDRARITWRLTFTKLTGRAMAAHIHSGRRGKAGGVMAPLCGPCRSGQRGTARITHAQLRTIRRGGAYVNVHTARNSAGEIRGQVVAADSNPVPVPPPTTPYPPPDPEPPPYP
jgi:CHRD domain